MRHLLNAGIPEKIVKMHLSCIYLRRHYRIYTCFGIVLVAVPGAVGKGHRRCLGYTFLEGKVA